MNPNSYQSAPNALTALTNYSNSEKHLGSSVEDNVGGQVNFSKQTSSSPSNNVQYQTFFPLKLHRIISDPRNEDVIRWLPSGKAFIIADKKRFAVEILPRFFSQACKFTSFTRKLTRWHFSRIPRGPLIGAYHHDLFFENQEHLVSPLTQRKTPNHIFQDSLLPFFFFIHQCYQMVCKIESSGSKRLSVNQFKVPDIFRQRTVTNASHDASSTHQHVYPVPQTAMIPNALQHPSLNPLYTIEDRRKYQMVTVDPNQNYSIQPQPPLMLNEMYQKASFRPKMEWAQNEIFGSQVGNMLRVEENIRKLKLAQEQHENIVMMQMYEAQRKMYGDNSIGKFPV